MHLCLCRFEVRRRERMQRERCVWYGRQSALWLAPPRLLVSRSVFYVLSSSLLTDIYPPPHSSLYPHCRHVSSSSLPAHTQAQRQWAQCVSRPRRRMTCSIPFWQCLRKRTAPTSRGVTTECGGENVFSIECAPSYEESRRSEVVSPRHSA